MIPSLALQSGAKVENAEFVKMDVALNQAGGDQPTAHLDNLVRMAKTRSDVDDPVAGDPDINQGTLVGSTEGAYVSYDQIKRHSMAS